MPDFTSGVTRASTPEDVATAIRTYGMDRVINDLHGDLAGAYRLLLKHINVEELTAQSAAMGSISVDKIIVGNMGVQSMGLNNVSATLQSGSATLEGVSMILNLHFFVDWWYDVGLWSDSGTWDLGTLSIGMSVGTVSIPSLGNIQMNIPSVHVNSVQAQMAPLLNLNLGSGQMEGLKVQKTSLPTAGFSIDGMSFGALSVNSAGFPAANTVAATVAHFRATQPVVIPSVSVSGVSLPSTTVPSVQSGAINTTAIASDRSVGVNAGILGITLRVTPSVDMHVDTMRMQHLALAASVGSIVIENVSVPIDVYGMNLKNLALQGIGVNTVSVV